MLNWVSCDKSLGHIKINSWEVRVSKWMGTIVVDKVKMWMEPTQEKISRGKPTPTNHTDSVNLAPNHVEME